MKRWWPVLLLATGCACAPTYHDDTTYAPPAMQQQIELCATEGSCSVLCARAFNLELGTIDSCKIVDRDGSGGATVKVNYHQNLCAADYDDVDVSDFGSDYNDDPCSDGSCDPPDDYDPCSDGSCDDPPPDDPPPDDPPPDDPPPDDPDPPM